MASYTALTVTNNIRSGDSSSWFSLLNLALPSSWSLSVPPFPPPVIVTVNVPAGQVSFG